MATKKKPSQRKINSEVTKMLRAYEALIKNPSKEVHKWNDYGSTTSCRMCALFHSMEDSNNICMAECPLSHGEAVDFMESYPCTDYSEDGTDTSNELNSALYSCDCDERVNLPSAYKEVREKAKNRYEWILKRLAENGYEYK